MSVNNIDFSCPNIDLPDVLPAAKRVIVIGDIHGDLEKLLESLKIANLIDASLNWIGNTTIVVQLGDQIDSCRLPNNCKHLTNDKAQDMAVIRFMTDLHIQALRQGGAVYSLLGNHELMNVNGDFTYVSYANIVDFKDYPSDGNGIIQKRKNAFKPGSNIAKFLACTRYAALIIGSNLFVHGGIMENFAKDFNVSKVNTMVRNWLNGIKNNHATMQKVLFSSDFSPFWTRTLGLMENKPNLCNNVDNILNYYQVGRIIVGHTPQKSINHVCDKKVWRADVGMSSAFDSFYEKKNRIEILEIINDGQEFKILKSS